MPLATGLPTVGFEFSRLSSHKLRSPGAVIAKLRPSVACASQMWVVLAGRRPEHQAISQR